MNNHQLPLFIFLSGVITIITLSVSLKTPVLASPLYTNSRWIVDDGGKRVKLACVNWPSHLQTMVAEGLSKQPVDIISKKILYTGFNCVRFTWPLFLATNLSLGSLTVKQSFQSLGLIESVAGIKVNNPSFLDLSVLQAFQAVVENLGENDLMVVLDNHISTPGWCCSNYDDNGFFGDKYFDPNVWINGLTRMATLFNGTSNVVGMSLRNELRGAKQNVKDWYRYMQKGAEAVHSANPDVLVILSGLSYDTDFSFIANNPVNLTFTRKLVFEVHWYGFSDGKAWENGNPNEVCGSIVGNIMRRGTFLLDQGWPVFLSEWGVDQRGTNVNDNRYFNCLMGFAAELDLDWGMWALTGSYHLRQGVMAMDEVYGILNWDWCAIRNQTFVDKISVLQSPLQGPGLSDAKPHKIIFHPATGLCVLRISLLKPLKLGSCAESEAWTYTAQETLVLKGTYFCLQADGLGRPAKLGNICGYSNSKWEMISDSKMHLTSTLLNGTAVCLDVDSENNIVTNSCSCIRVSSTCDPGSQWFKIVNSTTSTTGKLSLPTDPLLGLNGNVVEDQTDRRSIQ